jgi:hypothetical protein
MLLILEPQGQRLERGRAAGEAVFERMLDYNRALEARGVLLASDSLKSEAARLEKRRGSTQVLDGPFAESKEMIAGYMLIQAKSKEEAIAWMRRAPFPDGVRLEIRQIFDDADFAPSDPTGELRAKEQELRERLASRKG